MTLRRLVVWLIAALAAVSSAVAVDLAAALPLIDPAAEWTVRDGVLTEWRSEAHPEVPTAAEIAAARLTAGKRARLAAIKARTVALVEAGTFAYGGKAFALDSETRSNWVGAIAAVNAGLMQYPRQVTAVDGTRVTIANDSEAKAFYGAGVAAVSAIEESAYPLVDAVLAAADLDELAAVEDER